MVEAYITASNATPASAPVITRAGADTTAHPKRSTIEDVASAAGVSVATVSRAMRNLPNVAMSTQRHVVDIANRLGYSADPAASRLAAGRTETITIVIPTLSGWYFSTVVAGAEAVFAEAGYDVLVVGVGSQSDLSRIVSERYHLDRRTDGLVVIDVVVQPDQVESIARRNVALTSVGNRIAGHPSVRIDNELVGRMAADHLIGLGHRRCGMIGSQPIQHQSENPLGFDVPALRHKGFVEGLAAHGVELDEDLVEGGNFGIDGGMEAMGALLDHPEPPTAVFSMSDEMAFGALMALAERGRVVGEDVSLIGVDDHEFSRVVGLTTIHQPVADHGAAAARLLIGAIDEIRNPHPDRAPDLERTHDVSIGASDVVAPVRIVERATTGPVRR